MAWKLIGLNPSFFLAQMFLLKLARALHGNLYSAHVTSVAHGIPPHRQLAHWHEQEHEDNDALLGAASFAAIVATTAP